MRQSAPGIGEENTTFSVPEIEDLRSSVKTLSAFCDFSTMGFTISSSGLSSSHRRMVSHLAASYLSQRLVFTRHHCIQVSNTDPLYETKDYRFV